MSYPPNHADTMNKQPSQEKPSQEKKVARNIPVRPAMVRGAIYLGFWLLLAGTDLADLTTGFAAAAAATWASLRLLPPTRGRLRYPALARLALRFGQESIMGGVDVARRALHPRLPLRPGFLVYPVCLPLGAARNAFCAMMSAMPGTLPAGMDEGGALLYHCLNVEQSVAAQLSLDEELLRQALGGADDDA
jgi:multicomponent Na+:H+ antiporter subunit E